MHLEVLLLFALMQRRAAQAKQLLVKEEDLVGGTTRMQACRNVPQTGGSCKRAY